MVYHVPEFQPRQCPVCKLTINGKISPLANRLHTRSLAHRRAPIIRELLQSGAALEQIGMQLGVTRERVRQLANRMGLPRKAQIAVRKARAEEQRLTNFLNKLPGTRLGRFLEQCAARGLSSELVPYNTSNTWRTNRAIVNGKDVLVKPAFTVHNAFGTLYVRIVKSQHPVDLIAYELPDGRWAFFKPFGPIDRSNSTMFALHEVKPGDKGYTLNRNHHHREGIENWALLTGENQ